MIQQTTPVFVKAAAPKGCGQTANTEFVNVNQITRVNLLANGAEIFYESADTNGEVKGCSATINKKELGKLNILA